MMRQWPEGVALIIPGKGTIVRMAEHLPKLLTEPDLPGNGFVKCPVAGETRGAACISGRALVAGKGPGKRQGDHFGHPV